MKLRDGHEKPVEEYIMGCVVLGMIALISYFATGYPLVFPPEVWGFDRELNDQASLRLS